MHDKPLEMLLAKINRGDLEAAEQVFTAYEPYLRMVVRRHLPDRLRAKFDSIDVVQSVWVHLLHGLRGTQWRFADSDHLRAFLITVTRRRLTSRFRCFRSALEREQPGALHLEGLPAPSQPRPSEVAQASELWEKMLALCSPDHQELLYLKKMGLRYDEIAIRTGMHEGSVRRIFRRLARQISCQIGSLSST